MDNPFIKLENVSYAYETENEKSIDAVKNISLEIKKGSFTALLGHNGSGKSTLAKLLNLILIPVSGKIYIDGKEIKYKNMSDDDIFNVRRKIGMVFQNPDNQLVATIVEEDIAFGPENLGIEPKEIRRRVDDALHAVGMSEFARRSPHELSGGQKQRIAIAGILAMQPECIVFDESTAMLDPRGRDDVMRIIEKLNRENGITVIHITHNMEEAVRADRIIVMNDGEIFLDGTPREVFSEVSLLQSVGLDVPQATELLYELEKDGYDVPRGVLDDNEASSVIKNLIKQYGENNVKN